MSAWLRQAQEKWPWLALATPKPKVATRRRRRCDPQPDAPPPEPAPTPAPEHDPKPRVACACGATENLLRYPFQNTPVMCQTCFNIRDDEETRMEILADSFPALGVPWEEA